MFQTAHGLLQIEKREKVRKCKIPMDLISHTQCNTKKPNHNPANNQL